MRTIHDTTQIIETRTVGNDPFEICATGRAEYDEAGSRLQIELDAFVRRVNLRGADAQVRPAWLPRADQVSDHLPLAEASDEFKEVFRAWSAKVRHSVPAQFEFENSITAAR